jgi:hypothetical protein
VVKIGYFKRLGLNYDAGIHAFITVSLVVNIYEGRYYGIGRRGPRKRIFFRHLNHGMGGSDVLLPIGDKGSFYNIWTVRTKDINTVRHCNFNAFGKTFYRFKGPFRVLTPTRCADK